MCLRRDHQRVHATNNNVFLRTLASEKNLVQEILPLAVLSVSRYAKRICAFTTVTDQHKIKLKVYTGADICAVNINDIKDFSFPVDIKKDDNILKGILLQ